jgi:hypothetical protein
VVVAVVSMLDQVRCLLTSWDLRRFGVHQPQVIGVDVFDQGCFCFWLNVGLIKSVEAQRN